MHYFTFVIFSTPAFLYIIISVATHMCSIWLTCLYIYFEVKLLKTFYFTFLAICSVEFFNQPYAAGEVPFILLILGLYLLYIIDNYKHQYWKSFLIVLLVQQHTGLLNLIGSVFYLSIFRLILWKIINKLFQQKLSKAFSRFGRSHTVFILPLGVLIIIITSLFLLCFIIIP